MKELRVWDLQTRIFHWSLVFFTACSFALADMPQQFGIKTVNSDIWLGFHIAAGTAVPLLIIFRIFWGFSGPVYSRFSSFTLGRAKLLKYLRATMRGEKISYMGHNPGASWAAMGVIIMAPVVAITGGILFGVDEARGLLRSLYADFHPYAMEMKLLHYGMSFILLGIIFVHLSGVILETLRHGLDTVRAMLTGEKRIPDNSPDETQKVSVSLSASLLSVLLIALPLPVALYIYSSINLHQPERMVMPKTYTSECGDCHMAFPPNLLPAKSWKAVMAGLSDHFGEDATLDEPERADIEKFLVENSAEKSREEAAIKLRRSIPEGQAPLSITAIGYWKKKHSGIRPETYKRKSVRSKSNCVACHKWAEYGSFEDNDIKIPRS
ncbi:MAG: cytochrome b/b6 domain-containing protein [Thermodesulfovibrionales bacterium]|jgi:cytochrome b